ncbi:MAG: M28 family metallopeptidase [Planctomycetota bacterium]|nr:M28 family metallopeptidase [Planctomycetota bacterium]
MTSIAALAVLAATCSDNQQRSRPTPTALLKPAHLAKDFGARAYTHVAQVVKLGPRHTGSPGWRNGIDYIAAELARCGLKPVRDRWRDPVEKIDFENVHVTIPGSSRHRIVIACHHDTKNFTGHDDPTNNFHFVGANDSGSGVGLLLALAPILKNRQNRATIQLVFFDGEESLEIAWNPKRSLFGSRRFLSQNRSSPIPGKPQSRIRCLILLDMIGAKDLQIDDDLNSDPDLKAIFLAAAAGCGHKHLMYENQRSISDDHLPFLEEGIPAIDLIDLADNPQWHTPNDTLEHISAESLRIVAQIVLTALPTVEDRYFPKKGKIRLPDKR